MGPVLAFGAGAGGSPWDGAPERPAPGKGTGSPLAEGGHRGWTRRFSGRLGGSSLDFDSGIGLSGKLPLEVLLLNRTVR